MNSTLRAALLVSRVDKIATVFRPIKSLLSTIAPQKPEEIMRALLVARFKSTICTVEDTSGGCGAFYRVVCVSPMFEGMRPLAQHRAVQEVLKMEIGTMHGLTIETRAK